MTVMPRRNRPTPPSAEIAVDMSAPRDDRAGRDHSAATPVFNLPERRQVPAFSRRRTPEWCLDLDPHEVMRAQGMPGEGLTHGPPADKKQAAVTTGAAR